MSQKVLTMKDRDPKRLVNDGSDNQVRENGDQENLFFNSVLGSSTERYRRGIETRMKNPFQ